MNGFDDSLQVDYYILSTKFLAEWMEYVGYDEKNTKLQPNLSKKVS